VGLPSKTHKIDCIILYYIIIRIFKRATFNFNGHGNYFIVVLDYDKELVAGGGIKKLGFLEGVHLLVLTFPMFIK
jgi:hypothetical protein